MTHPSLPLTKYRCWSFSIVFFFLFPSPPPSFFVVISCIHCFSVYVLFIDLYFVYVIISGPFPHRPFSEASVPRRVLVLQLCAILHLCLHFFFSSLISMLVSTTCVSPTSPPPHGCRNHRFPVRRWVGSTLAYALVSET